MGNNRTESSRDKTVMEYEQRLMNSLIDSMFEASELLSKRIDRTSQESVRQLSDITDLRIAMMRVRRIVNGLYTKE